MTTVNVGPERIKGHGSFSERIIEGPWEPIEAILNQSLFDPVQTLFIRPGKNIRAKMVRVGLGLSREINHASTSPDAAPSSAPNSAPDTELTTAVERLGDALEAIHAGSLVIDDIQDGSRERRGAPCLHEVVGIPIALNAGNWLYFKPFEWIRELGLPERIELRLYRLFHQTMIHAHMGQALDLGVQIDKVEQHRVREIALTSLRLKTGALMALAIGSGATLGDASEQRTKALCEFGVQFGVALQMFDDIGNFNLPKAHPKSLEDFKLRRPSWLWAVAANQTSQIEYQNLLKAVGQLPDDSALRSWLHSSRIIEKARSSAAEHLDSTLKKLMTHLSESGSPHDASDETERQFWNSHSRALQDIHELTERIKTSYG